MSEEWKTWEGGGEEEEEREGWRGRDGEGEMSLKKWETCWLECLQYSCDEL